MFDRNEELIDLVKSLDEKMNVLEQYFIKNVPDGEKLLMELINGPEMNPDQEETPMEDKMSATVRSLSLR